MSIALFVDTSAVDEITFDDATDEGTDPQDGEVSLF